MEKLGKISSIYPHCDRTINVLASLGCEAAGPLYLSLSQAHVTQFSLALSLAFSKSPFGSQILLAIARENSFTEFLSNGICFSSPNLSACKSISPIPNKKSQISSSIAIHFWYLLLTVNFFCDSKMPIVRSFMQTLCCSQTLSKFRSSPSSHFK